MKKEGAYKHAGMIQLTPQGKMVFLHNTADSKWDPRHNHMFYSNPISYVTFPLNPDQAFRVFMDGWMFTDKFSIRNTTSCPSSPGLELLDTIRRCKLQKAINIEEEPRIPLIDVHVFPELLHTIDEAYRVFQDWQISFFKNTNPLSSLFEL